MHAAAQSHRRLDELVLEVLASHQLPPAASPRTSEVSIEIVFDDDDERDIAVTNQFVRFSAPYERVDLDLEPPASALARPRRRPITFANIIRASDTQPEMRAADIRAAETITPVTPASDTRAFDAVWFDRSEDSLAHIEAVVPRLSRARQWVWLAISIAAAGAAIATIVFS
jgi:hypothetical protein